MTIACDIARALLYLHTADYEAPFIHRGVSRLRYSIFMLLLWLHFTAVLMYCWMHHIGQSWVMVQQLDHFIIGLRLNRIDVHALLHHLDIFLLNIIEVILQIKWTVLHLEWSVFTSKYFIL